MKNRVFTPEFKLSIVKAVTSGEKTVVQLCGCASLLMIRARFLFFK